jgi:hypothetical protein
MSDVALARKEECRHAVLAFLVDRPVVSHSVAAIRRGINREGGDFTEPETREGVELLVGLALAKDVPDPLGSTRYYQATSAGVLAHERGRA